MFIESIGRNWWWILNVRSLKKKNGKKYEYTLQNLFDFGMKSLIFCFVIFLKKKRTESFKVETFLL